MGREREERAKRAGQREHHQRWKGTSIGKGRGDEEGPEKPRVRNPHDEAPSSVHSHADKRRNAPPRFFAPLCAFLNCAPPVPPHLFPPLLWRRRAENVPECGTGGGRREGETRQANAPRGARVLPSGIAGTTRGKRGDGPGSRPPTPAGLAAAMRRTPTRTTSPGRHARTRGNTVRRRLAGGPRGDWAAAGPRRTRRNVAEAETEIPPTGIGNRRTGSETTPKGRPAGGRPTRADPARRRRGAT